jgi:hypothetical protein
MGLAMSFPQLIIVALLLFGFLYPSTRICRKAGLSPWLGFALT